MLEKFNNVWVELLNEEGTTIKKWEDVRKAEVLDFEYRTNIRCIKILTKEQHQILLIVAANNTLVIEAITKEE